MHLTGQRINDRETVQSSIGEVEIAVPQDRKSTFEPQIEDWQNVLNELKNRGVKDIMIICADWLSEIKEAIAAAY